MAVYLIRVLLVIDQLYNLAAHTHSAFGNLRLHDKANPNQRGINVFNKGMT